MSALTGWLRARPVTLVPVHVRPDVAHPEPGSSVRIVLPSGVRIEWLHVSDVAAVLADLT